MFIFLETDSLFPIFSLIYPSLAISDFHLPCALSNLTSKTDIYRQDHTVVIARTNNDTCPVAMCETYLLKADIALDSDDFILSIYFSLN
jgi:hypothetical protein